jgi:hypothetical protein
MGAIKSMRDIKNIKTKVSTLYPSVFSKPEVINESERLHEEFDLVPIDFYIW